jgi:hypothetical protein
MDRSQAQTLLDGLSGGGVLVPGGGVLERLDEIAEPVKLELLVYDRGVASAWPEIHNAWRCPDGSHVIGDEGFNDPVGMWALSSLGIGGRGILDMDSAMAALIAMDPPHRFLEPIARRWVRLHARPLPASEEIRPHHLGPLMASPDPDLRRAAFDLLARLPNVS